MKNWLGIESVKVELALPQELRASLRVLHGTVRLSSQHDQRVTAIRVKLIERYQRGRGAEQLTDEYELGQVLLDQTVAVPAGAAVTVPFALPFVRARSGVEELAQRNVLFRGLARVAKWTDNVQSDYRVVAEATVPGVALSPFDEQAIVLQPL